MGENPELIAMARRIAASTKVGAEPQDFIDGVWDNSPVVQATLAAIIETQERDAALVESITFCTSVGDIAVAIRSGQHYGKDYPHA